MNKFTSTIAKGFKKKLTPVFLPSTAAKKKVKSNLRKVRIFLQKLKKKKKFKGLLFIRHNKNIRMSVISLKKRLNSAKKEGLDFNIVPRTRFSSYKTLFLKNNMSFSDIIPSLYKKFLFSIFKVGKKNVWEANFASIFDLLSIKLKYSKSILLLKIFSRLFTRVEVKKVSARKRTTYIPIFIKIQRSLFLALKWIFLATLKPAGSTSFKNKLFMEILQLLVHKSCFSLKKCQENNAFAFKNRSNIHYRWQRTR